MLNFKRTVIAAVVFIRLFYMLTLSYNSQQPELIAEPFPNPNQAPNSAHASSTTGASGSRDQSNVVGTGRGSNVAAAPQKNLQDMSKMTLVEKLAHHYPYDVKIKFPAHVWQTWLYTPAEAKFQFPDEEATWTRLHPGFTHKVITDTAAANLIKRFYAAVPEVLEAYKAMPLPVLKADFFRYLILLARGGVYSDIDTSALKSAVDWVPESVPCEAVGLVVGIEADPDRPDWHDWYSRRIQFCQWTILAKPGHPVLRKVVAAITEETLKKQRAGLLAGLKDNVVEFTGPAMWTDVMFGYFNDPQYFNMSTSKGAIGWWSFTGMSTTKKVGDVIVLPITSFSPGVGHMGAKPLTDPMAFVKHGFEGSWKPENERHVSD